MTKLYELSNNVIGLRSMLDDELIDEQTFLDTLESIEGELAEKAEGLLKFEREILGDVSTIDAEIKRLTRRKAIIKNRAESLREYLRSNMERSGIDKIACPLFAITLKKPTATLVVEDYEAIPRRFYKTKTTTTLDRKAVLDTLKAGRKVPGAMLGESKRALLIK